MVRQKEATELGREKSALQLYHLMTTDQWWAHY